MEFCEQRASLHTPVVQPIQLFQHAECTQEYDPELARKTLGEGRAATSRAQADNRQLLVELVRTATFSSDSMR
jgi:hypothetical protein